jgi:TPP-dependent pyruvate/acetoin dehydrogenase alpha subunit
VIVVYGFTEDFVIFGLCITFKLSEKEIEEIHQRVQLEVDESVQFAEDSPWPDDDELLKDVYVQQDYPFITD